MYDLGMQTMNDDLENCNLTDMNMAEFFSGRCLYGDNFDQASIAKWFDQEREAYAELGARNEDSYVYAYHALNQMLGFRYLPAKTFSHAIGLGSAYGDEFLPLADRLNRVTIIEPSEELRSLNRLPNTQIDYVTPTVSGDIPLGNETADLCLSLGVLHHIPNVSAVVSECSRCLQEGGYFITKEPMVSMGDWRRRRPGLTRNERGIPRDLFIKILRDANLQVVSIHYFNLFVVRHFSRLFRAPCYDSFLTTKIDLVLSRLLSWNYSYHRTTFLSKFAPASQYVVAIKKSN